jgi:RNA polymerase sigma-B factor
LWQRARQGDRSARERLIELHMPLARSLAVQYRHAREPLDDLCQVANLGLVKAVDRYDPDRSIAFTSFAVPTILGELKRHFRDRTWTIHVSRSVQESIARVEKVSEELRSELGPEVADLDLRSLHPREFVRKHLLEDDPEESRPVTQSVLRTRQPPPWDPDAT